MIYNCCWKIIYIYIYIYINYQDYVILVFIKICLISYLIIIFKKKNKFFFIKIFEPTNFRDRKGENMELLSIIIEKIKGWKRLKFIYIYII